MRIYEFTIDEKKYIEETLNIVLDDLEEIVKLFPKFDEYVEVDGVQLYIDKDRTYLYVAEASMYNTYTNLLEPQVKVIKEDDDSKEENKEKKKKFWSRNKDIEPEHIEIVYTRFYDYSNEKLNYIARFLANYETYRNKLIKKLKTLTDDKNDLFSKLQTIRAKYSNEIYLDFGHVTTQNVRTLEVTSENGRNVGTLDLGGKIVKIISDGDIVLKKIEPVKEKIKQKEEKIKTL